MAAAMLTGPAQAASAVDLGLDPIVAPLVDGVGTAAENALEMVNGITEAPAAEAPAADGSAADGSATDGPSTDGLPTDGSAE